MSTAEDISWAVKDLRDRAPDILLNQKYYKGDHRQAFATEKWETAFGKVFRRLRDNLCPRVVDTKADRLQLSGFTTGEDSADSKLADLWKANRLDRRAGETHKSALRDGTAYAIIWPDSIGSPRFYPQRAERMAVRWSEDVYGDLDLAAKLWPQSTDDRSFWRLNLYYPDRIERFITRQVLDGRSPDVPEKPDAWQPYTEADTVDDPIRGSSIRNDFGRVPVFVWANNADTGEYGMSELSDVIPLQDALNKEMADMLVAGEFSALPQRWVAGLDVMVGPDGEPVNTPFEAGADRIWSTPNENARFGQFDPTNLAGFVSVQDSLRAEIARVSATPLHYLLLSGNFPSGEALRAAEAPLEAAVRDRQLDFGTTWEDASAFLLKVGGMAIDDVTVSWTDTKTANEKEHLEALTAKKALGVPDKQLWTEMGYDEAQIKDFESIKEENRAKMEASFNSGQPGVGDLTGGQDASASYFGGGQ